MQTFCFTDLEVSYISSEYPSIYSLLGVMWLLSGCWNSHRLLLSMSYLIIDPKLLNDYNESALDSAVAGNHAKLVKRWFTEEAIVLLQNWIDFKQNSIILSVNYSITRWALFHDSVLFANASLTSSLMTLHYISQAGRKSVSKKGGYFPWTVWFQWSFFEWFEGENGEASYWSSND